MVPASELAAEIVEALEQGLPVTVSPQRFEALLPDTPEQEFLKFDIVISEGSFSQDTFTLSGRADLINLGTSLEVDLSFEANYDDNVSSLSVTVHGPLSLTQHPVTDRLLGELPLQAGVHFTDLIVRCDFTEAANNSHLGIGMELTDLGVEVEGGASSRFTLDQASLESVSLSTPGVSEELPSSNSMRQEVNFPILDMVRWAGIPEDVIPGQFQDWQNATSLRLWWGTELSQRAVTLDGDAEVF
ncbi:hypothetical protein, partial [Streptomyces formicae]